MFSKIQLRRVTKEDLENFRTWRNSINIWKNNTLFIFLNMENQKKWITFKPTANYGLEVSSKKLNINGFYTFIASFIKVLPLVKSIFKFNYPPNFSLKMPLYIQKTDFKFYTHCPIKKVRKIVGNDFFNKAFKFTIVRNPYDQFLSFYSDLHYKIKNHSP